MKLWYDWFYNLEFLWRHRLFLFLSSIILLIDHLNHIIKASRWFDLVLALIIVLKNVWRLDLSLLAEAVTRHYRAHSVLVHGYLILRDEAPGVISLTIWNTNISKLHRVIKVRQRWLEVIKHLLVRNNWRWFVSGWNSKLLLHVWYTFGVIYHSRY